MSLSIRRATMDDAGAINEIYNYYVLRSTCTFQEEPETPEGRKAWLEAHNNHYPVFVAEEGGQVVGWASLSRYHQRAAYRFTVENSVYVRHDARGRKIGSLLMSRLIETGRENNFHSIVAIIAGEEADSIAFHRGLGFREVGHITEAGYKFGHWIDIRLYQLMI
jgi:L-amino acid N-acyltransferase YncA